MVQRKKIIILTICMGNDGAGRVLSELSEEWLKRGCEVTVVQTGADNYGVSFQLSDEVNVINIRTSSKSKLFRYFDEIKQVITTFNKQPDATVIAFIVGSIFVSGVASFFTKNRLVVSERNNPRECPSGKLQQKLRDWAFGRADCCVFQTEEARKMFPKKIQRKGVIIPNPINTNLPQPFNGRRRKAIVAACRLHPQKNLPMLIQAFYRFHKKYPDYVLEIYGQGSEREKLEKMINTLELNKYVIMPGFADNIQEKMWDASMYVSSSDYEGISNSMLEALCMGVPTIVTDCPVGGARMAIQNNINGILIPVRNIEGMASAMEKIVKDKGFAESLSRESVKIREEWPLSKIADQWLEII